MIYRALPYFPPCFFLYKLQYSTSPSISREPYKLFYYYHINNSLSNDNNFFYKALIITKIKIRKKWLTCFSPLNLIFLIAIFLNYFLMLLYLILSFLFLNLLNYMFYSYKSPFFFNWFWYLYFILWFSYFCQCTFKINYLNYFLLISTHFFHILIHESPSSISISYFQTIIKYNKIISHINNFLDYDNSIFSYV